MSDKKGLILDLDNTLYNWIDFFATSFRAMVHTIGRTTGLDEDAITDSFRRVYLKHNTVEYSFAIQELDVLANLGLSPLEIQQKIVRPAKSAFSRTRSKHLKLYPHVKETLQWAKNEGIVVVGFTDLVLIHAEMRLKFLRVDHLFDALFSWCVDEIPSYASEEVKSKAIAGKYSSRIPIKHELYEFQLKPNTAGLRIVLDRLQLSAKSTYLVGDNLWKDISLAQAVGVKDIWARYGRYLEGKNLETLKKITPWSGADITKYEKAKSEVTPTYTIDDFSEIKSIIGSRQTQFSFE